MEDYWKTASIYSWGPGPEAGTYKSGRVSLEKLQIIFKIHEVNPNTVQYCFYCRPAVFPESIIDTNVLFLLIKCLIFFVQN